MVLVFSVYCYPQNSRIIYVEMKPIKIQENKMSFNPEYLIYKSFKFCAEPQFGGLFENSFKEIEGIRNFNQFYNYFDFGLNFVPSFEVIKGLKLKGICNLGMLRFRSYDEVKPEHYTMKLSLSFVF